MRFSILRCTQSITVLTLLAVGGHAQAQTNDAEVFGALYQKLQVAVGVDPKKAGQVNGSSLILFRPGRALDFAPEDADNDLVVKESLAAVANQLPAPSFYFEAGGNDLEKVWDAILKFKQSPNSSITDAQKATLEAAQKFLDEPAKAGDPETRLECYDRYNMMYDQALDNWLAEKAQAVVEKRAAKTSIETASKIALRDWESPTKGNRKEVEAKIEAINENCGKDPLTFWNTLRSEWDNTFKLKGVNGTTFHEISTIPSIKAWKQNAGWTKIILDSSKENFSAAESSFSAGAKGKAQFGLLQIAASGDYSKDSKMEKASSKSVKIEVEVKRVMIYRPWLNAVVFRAGFWRFGSDPLATPWLNVSEGKGITDGKTRGNELMPLLPTEFLLARNVKILADFSDSTVAAVKSGMSGQGSVGYGPFALTAHAKSSKSSLDKTANVTKTEISFAEPQIIGVYVNVLGKVPNPDTSLFK